MSAIDVVMRAERDGITITQALKELTEELNLTLSTKEIQELIHNAVAALC